MTVEETARHTIEIAKQREGSPTNPIALAVFAIVVDICDRRGLKHEWRQIDEEIQKEIKDTWEAIICGCLNP